MRLVIDIDSDSDYDSDDYDMTQGRPSRDSALEYRWRSWADGERKITTTLSESSDGATASGEPNPHPTLSTAAIMMRFTADKVREKDAAAVRKKIVGIKSDVEADAAGKKSPARGRKRRAASPPAGTSGSKRKRRSPTPTEGLKGKLVTPSPSPSPPLPASMERLNHLKLPDINGTNNAGGFSIVSLQPAASALGPPQIEGARKVPAILSMPNAPAPATISGVPAAASSDASKKVEGANIIPKAASGLEPAAPTAAPAPAPA